MTDQHSITRRQVIRAAGAAGAATVLSPQLVAALRAGLASAATPCVRLTPELTQGPYWVNTMLQRSDVRANTSHPGVLQAGVPLALTINVLDASRSCRPLNGVAVDIWHANAHGLYSDESSQQSGGGTSGGDTAGENFLRGYQLTGIDRGERRAPVSGQVNFKTIWPGWYSGRAIHIHVRVRKLDGTGATVAGYTTQIFFTDAANRHVLTSAAPYNTRSPQMDPTTDESDTVLSSADHSTNIVAVRGSVASGYSATFNIELTAAEVTT